MKAARVVAALLLTACAQKHAAPAAAPVVKTTVAQIGDIAPSETLAGVIAPYENVAIQSTLTEPADAVYVQEGDRISAGQLLARLDTADLEAQLDSDLATANSNHAMTTHDVYQGSLTISQGYDTLQSANAAVDQAQGNLARDHAQLTRDLALFKQGYVSEEAVQQDQATVRADQSAINTAQSNVAAAKSTVQANGSLGSGGGLEESTVQQAQAQEQVAMAQAQQVRVQIAKATILSPIDGVVVNRNLNPGEYPGTRQIFTLQQVNPIYAVLHGSGAQVAHIDTGTPARVTASDLGVHSQFDGKVAGVLNQINPGSTDFQVKALLQNPFRQLRPGMAVTAQIVLPVIRGIEVPATAFTDDNHDAVLTVGSDGTVATSTVTELSSAGNTAIVTGIPAGTRVVDDGQQSLGDGEKVSYK
jgi:HlyD family secretion protein